MTPELLEAISKKLVDPMEINATVFEFKGKLALNGCLFTVNDTIFLITGTYKSGGLYYSDVKNTSNGKSNTMLHDDVIRIVKEEQVKREQEVEVFEKPKQSQDELQKRLNFDA
jgi:hypothetical protein